MSANPVARPASTRRSFLAAGTAAAAIGAPAIAKSKPDLVLPDPVFALIEAERVAYATLEAASSEWSDAEFAARPWKRKPRVLIGEYTAIARQPDFELIPLAERKPEPVYAYSHEEIDCDCDAHVRWPASGLGDPAARRSRLHRAFEEDAAAIKNAPEVVRDRAARAAWDEANDRAEAALLALCTATPTTATGMLAMFTVFLEREIDNLDTPHIAQLRGLMAAARSVLTREA